MICKLSFVLSIKEYIPIKHRLIMLHIGNKMGYSKMLASALLLAFAVLQGTEGYSPKAEEALKNLTDYQLIVPKEASSGSVNGLKVTANSVAGVSDFWTDKVIQAANQADQVTRFTLPEFVNKVNNLDVVLARIETQNVNKLKDAKTLFNTAAMPIKTAIEIAYLVKNVPMESVTYDKVKELLENAMNVVSLVKPALTVNNSRILAEVKAALSKATKDLEQFTTKYLRDQCYPNVVCVANKLDDLKRSVQNAANTIAKGSDSIIQTSMQVDVQTNIKIREEEQKIKNEAKKWAELYFKTYSITMDTIKEYFLQILVKYNPSAKQVEELVSNALSKLFELSYYYDLGKNLTRNQIFGAVYPVVDSYNTVFYLGRNYGGKILGNEVSVTYQYVTELYNEAAKIMPDFTNEINAFYEEIRKINVSATVLTKKYVEQSIDESKASDLLEFYALYSGIVYEEIPQPIDEAKEKVNGLLAQVASLTPKVIAAFEKLQIAMDLKIQKLFEDYMYGVANRFYTGGKLQMKDLYYFGSLNLNNTFKYWTPIISTEDVAVETVYKAVVQKNYASLTIREVLINITAEVVNVLKMYEYLFGADAIKIRIANVVSRLVDIPSKDYLELIAYNLRNISDLYNSKKNYIDRLPVLEADRIAFLKLGVQTFPNSKVPFVDYNHLLNTKVYKSKLSLSDIVKALLEIKNGILASEAGINAAAGDSLERVRYIVKEYITLLHNYAQLKKEGKPFLSDLPSITVIAYRILRERYGLEVTEFPDFTDDIVRSDEYYASLSF